MHAGKRFSSSSSCQNHCRPGLDAPSCRWLCGKVVKHWINICDAQLQKRSCIVETILAEHMFVSPPIGSVALVHYLCRLLLVNMQWLCCRCDSRS